jgi:hypothetical protein
MRETFTSGSPRGEWATHTGSPSLLLYRLFSYCISTTVLQKWRAAVGTTLKPAQQHLRDHHAQRSD